MSMGGFAARKAVQVVGNVEKGWNDLFFTVIRPRSKFYTYRDYFGVSSGYPTPRRELKKRRVTSIITYWYNFEVIFTALYPVNITFQGAAAKLSHIFRVLFITF